MNVIHEISQYVEKNIGFNSEYVELIMFTILIFLFFTFLKAIVRLIYSKAAVSDKKKYFRNRVMKIVLTVLAFVSVILLWGHKISGIVTAITFLSTGVAIAVKEIIFDFFAGIYIGWKRPFELEDRVEIDGVKGDVINIKALSFEVLEVGGRIDSEQSTGRIVHIPNSFIFIKTLKNYTKAFKYIWDELKVNVSLDSNIEETKDILYNIMVNNEVLKEAPKKMEDAVSDIIFEYRIYYNYLDPIIYTKIVDSHIELSLRYIVHPKKARIVEDDIYLKILEEYKNGNIKLYV